MFEKIRLWWKFEGKYYHKDFIQGIKNLWKWFPTIWKDRDWDHSFIYTILAKKLENQAKYIGSNDRHMSASRDAEIMLLCVRLIKIQQEDLYGMEYMDYINKEYEFVPTDETKKWYTMEDTVIEDNLDEYFEKYPKAYKKITSGEEKDRQLIAMEIAEHNQQKSHKLLFKILEKHLESWWD